MNIVFHMIVYLTVSTTMLIHSMEQQGKKAINELKELADHSADRMEEDNRINTIRNELKHQLKGEAAVVACVGFFAATLTRELKQANQLELTGANLRLADTTVGALSKYRQAYDNDLEKSVVLQKIHGYMGHYIGTQYLIAERNQTDGNITILLSKEDMLNFESDLLQSLLLYLSPAYYDARQKVHNELTSQDLLSDKALYQLSHVVRLVSRFVYRNKLQETTFNALLQEAEKLKKLEGRLNT